MRYDRASPHSNRTLSRSRMFKDGLLRSGFKVSLCTHLRNIIELKLAIASARRILRVGCGTLVSTDSAQRLPVDLTHVIMEDYLNV